MCVLCLFFNTCPHTKQIVVPTKHISVRDLKLLIQDSETIQKERGQCWSVWRGQTYRSKIAGSPWPRTITAYPRGAPGRTHYQWCSRDQTSQARPMTHSNEHLQVKTSGLKGKLCVSMGPHYTFHAESIFLFGGEGSFKFNFALRWKLARTEDGCMTTGRWVRLEWTMWNSHRINRNKKKMYPTFRKKPCVTEHCFYGDQIEGFKKERRQGRNPVELSDMWARSHRGWRNLKFKLGFIFISSCGSQCFHCIWISMEYVFQCTVTSVVIEGKVFSDFNRHTQIKSLCFI